MQSRRSAARSGCGSTSPWCGGSSRTLTGRSQALREALALDNRNFSALLMQAALLDKLGRANDAALAYAIALVQAPPDAELDGPTRQAVARAREVHAKHVAELGHYVRDHVGPARDALSGAEKRRLESFIDTTLRTRKRYRQEPMEYAYPGLPDIEFYEREEFPWLPEFEAATADIQRELGRILVEDEAGFSPYIQYDDHLPLDQWRELNKSPRWSAFHFYDKGRAIEERCARGPRDDGGRPAAAAGHGGPALTDRDVLGAEAEDAHPAAHGHRQLPPRRAPAARASGRLRLSRRRRAA